MITWGDVIDITLYTFDLHKTDLSMLLECNSSKISKIRSGTQGLDRISKDRLFSLVLDPDKDSSPAQRIKGKKGNTKFLLYRLKEDIESQFGEVRKDMEDCWEEEDYQKFVLTMLGRARKGASSKKEVQHSDQSKSTVIASDIVPSGDCNGKQKKVSRQETPSEQMSRIFEQAVADFNVATNICKLPDYLNGESFYAGDIFDFISTIQTDILGKFVNQQNEDVFQNISDFKVALEKYASFLGVIRWAVSEKYGIMWKSGASYYEVLCLIDDDCSKAKTKLEDEVPSEEGSRNKSSIIEIETYLNQLEFLRSILSAYKQICDLYSEICTGKTLLVF